MKGWRKLRKKACPRRLVGKYCLWQKGACICGDEPLLANATLWRSPDGEVLIAETEDLDGDDLLSLVEWSGELDIEVCVWPGGRIVLRRSATKLIAKEEEQ